MNFIITLAILSGITTTLGLFTVLIKNFNVRLYKKSLVVPWWFNILPAMQMAVFAYLALILLYILMIGYDGSYWLYYADLAQDSIHLTYGGGWISAKLYFGTVFLSMIGAKCSLLLMSKYRVL